MGLGTRSWRCTGLSLRLPFPRISQEISGGTSAGFCDRVSRMRLQAAANSWRRQPLFHADPYQKENLHSREEAEKDREEPLPLNKEGEGKGSPPIGLWHHSGGRVPRHDSPYHSGCDALAERGVRWPAAPNGYEVRLWSETRINPKRT